PGAVRVGRRARRRAGGGRPGGLAGARRRRGERGAPGGAAVRRRAVRRRLPRRLVVADRTTGYSLIASSAFFSAVSILSLYFPWVAESTALPACLMASSLYFSTSSGCSWASCVA